jgi:hypothetical protein
MNIRLLGCLVICALFTPAPSRAQSPAPLFATSDAIHLTISAPLQMLIGHRNAQNSIPGTLTDPSGQKLPISLALRGITRRTSEICDFPPLRVEFTVPPPSTSIFAGQKKLKLVTHCRNSASFQQYVLLEYAGYKMYNVLTPHSFRARLAMVDYRDADDRPIISRTGFFLEPLKDLARRNGTHEAHAPNRIPLSFLSPPDAARYALFEYMIANHDWSMRAGPPGSDCCHNAELIGSAAPGAAMTIPYDFDYSGLVGAPYAVPPEGLGISSVRQRLYRGYCAHNADALAAARQMRAARPQILAVLAETPGLEPRTQRGAAAYLERFFGEIATDADLGSKVLNHCVGGQ